MASRDVADWYANQGHEAIVTANDRRRRAIGQIADVTDEQFTVKQASAPDEIFRHADVLEIWPNDNDR